MSPCISLDHLPDISLDVWLEERRFDLVIGRMLWNKEEEMAIFLRRDGMELETQETSARIDDLPTVQAPSIALSARHAAGRNDDPPLILSTIRKQFSPKMKQQPQTYDCLPKTTYPALIYDIGFQESSLSMTEHVFWRQENGRSLDLWIFLSIKVGLASIVTRKLSLPDCESVDITYQYQGFSIATTRLYDSGQCDEDRDEEKNGNARQWRLVDKRGNSLEMSDYG